MSKGAIERIEPNFVCKALISKEEVQKQETETLINKMFGGSSENFFQLLLIKKIFQMMRLQNLNKLLKN